jgi:hypothetical protein
MEVANMNQENINSQDNNSTQKRSITSSSCSPTDSTPHTEARIDLDIHDDRKRKRVH